MDLHIQKVADRMDEKRGAGQSSRILSQGLDPYEGGRSGDAKRGPLHAPGLELTEKEAPGVLRLVEHGLHSQDLRWPYVPI